MSKDEEGKDEHADSVEQASLKRESDKNQKLAQIYMKAMCLKKMLRFDEAIATYSMLKDEIHRAESKALIKSVFSIVTLFTNVDRSRFGDALDNF